MTSSFLRTSISEENQKKNDLLRKNLRDLDFTSILQLYNFLKELEKYNEEHQKYSKDQSKKVFYDNNAKRTMSLIQEKLKLTYNIRGVLTEVPTCQFVPNPDIINRILSNHKFDINFRVQNELREMNGECFMDNDANISYKDNFLYNIVLSGIDEETKTELLCKVSRFKNNTVFYFTNLAPSLIPHRDGNDNVKYSLVFKSTYNTKIWMQLEKISINSDNLIDNKQTLNSNKNAGLILDLLRKNEYTFLKEINSSELMERYPKFRKINNIITDFNNILELKVDSLFIDHPKDYFFDKFLKPECDFGLNDELDFNNEGNISYKNFDNNIMDNIFKKNYEPFNIFGIIKSKKIYEPFDKNNNNNKSRILIKLESIYDLNTITLDFPKSNNIFDDIIVNGLYLFLNVGVYLDKNFDIKLGEDTHQKSLGNFINKIGVFKLKDYDALCKSKNYQLKKMNFSSLITLSFEKILSRSIKKYLVDVRNITSIDAKLKNDIEYNATLIVSDGTSYAFLNLDHENVLSLFKFNEADKDIIKQKMQEENSNEIKVFSSKINVVEGKNFESIYESKIIVYGVASMYKYRSVMASNLLIKFVEAKDENEISNIDNEFLKSEYSMLNGALVDYKSISNKEKKKLRPQAKIIARKIEILSDE